STIYFYTLSLHDALPIFIPLSQKLIDFLKNKDTSPHVLLACNQFQASIDLIKDQLAFIYNILQNHKNKYFHRIRPPSLNKHLQRSEEHTSELQSRGHLVC